MELLGKTIHGIRVVDLLGRGGMGEVYVGFQERLERKVALKRIRPEFALESEMKARFLREARILSRLQHPNLCQVHDFIESEEGDLIVLELIEGRTLEKAMQEGGLAQDEKLRISEEIVEVLVAAHGQAVVHRDLKPGNVMLSQDGSVKVLDFGLARSVALDEEETVAWSYSVRAAPEPIGPSQESTFLRTTAGMIVGTPRYMSPEQARGEPATPASDMYSLGLLLQELFTGRPVYEKAREGVALLEQIAAARTLPVTGLDGDLSELIERLKQPEPLDRPSSREVLRWLRMIRDRTSSPLIVGHLALGVGVAFITIMTTLMGMLFFGYLHLSGYGPLWMESTTQPVVALVAYVVVARLKRKGGYLADLDLDRWAISFSFFYVGAYLLIVLAASLDFFWGSRDAGSLLRWMGSLLTALLGCFVVIRMARRETRRALRGELGMKV